MNLKRIKDEMQFITGVVTDDIDYLLFLMLRNNNKDINGVTASQLKEVNEKDELLEWFNNL